jgi:hypothetical protein
VARNIAARPPLCPEVPKTNKETAMPANDVDRVWELMDKISICMLTTHDGDKLRSRPMAAFVRREDDAVYFLTDAQHHKDEEIRDNPNVGLAFADGQKFVSVTGHAAVTRDVAKIKELWGHRRKHGGTRPTTRTSACSPSPLTMRNSGKARAGSSAPSRWWPPLRRTPAQTTVRTARWRCKVQLGCGLSSTAAHRLGECARAIGLVEQRHARLAGPRPLRNCSE